jgi:hypothetical protein
MSEPTPNLEIASIVYKTVRTNERTGNRVTQFVFEFLDFRPTSDAPRATFKVIPDSKRKLVRTDEVGFTGGKLAGLSQCAHAQSWQLTSVVIDPTTGDVSDFDSDLRDWDAEPKSAAAWRKEVAKLYAKRRSVTDSEINVPAVDWSRMARPVGDDDETQVSVVAPPPRRSFLQRLFGGV